MFPEGGDEGGERKMCEEGKRKVYKKKERENVNKINMEQARRSQAGKG